MEEETIDQFYQLNFKINSQSQIIVNKDLLEKLENYDYSPFPKDTEINRTQPSIFDIYIKGGRNIKIFRIPIDCRIRISEVEKKYHYIHISI